MLKTAFHLSHYLSNRNAYVNNKLLNTYLVNTVCFFMRYIRKKDAFILLIFIRDFGADSSQHTNL